MSPLIVPPFGPRAQLSFNHRLLLLLSPLVARTARGLRMRDAVLLAALDFGLIHNYSARLF